MRLRVHNAIILNLIEWRGNYKTSSKVTGARGVDGVEGMREYELDCERSG